MNSSSSRLRFGRVEIYVYKFLLQVVNDRFILRMEP